MMVMKSMLERSPDYKEFVTTALLHISQIKKNPLSLCSCSVAFMAHVGPPVCWVQHEKKKKLKIQAHLLC